MDNWLDGQMMSDEYVAGWLHCWSAQRALNAGSKALKGCTGIGSSSEGEICHLGGWASGVYLGICKMGKMGRRAVFFFNIYFYLAALGLSCSMRDLVP